MRLIHAADCEAVAALIRQAFAGLPVDPPPSARNVAAADVRAHLLAGGGGMVEPGDACVLWATLDGALHVSRLAVAPAARRQGLARAMLAAAEDEARFRGLACLTVSTRLALAVNRRLFEGCGYEEVGRASHPGFAVPTMVTLRKRLAADLCVGVRP